jgi:ribosome biogenesis GTPase A
MVAAVNKATEAMADNDLVIEVLDARFPQASSNPTIVGMRTFRQRPCLKVLNKTDVADPAITALWLAHFNAQPNTKAIAISCKKQGDVQKVIKAAQSLAPHRVGPFKTLRMMIMGIPNVGKSTLVNALLKKRSAKVGDEPAVTKILHRYDIGNHMTLTDTPGLMWPKIEHEAVGLMLAAGHSIGVNAYDEVEVAVFLARLLQERYPGVIQQRFPVLATSTAATSTATTSTGATQAAATQATSSEQHNVSTTNAEFDADRFIEQLALQRGFFLKARKHGATSEDAGRELDITRAANTFLVDFRNHRLGALSLESPNERTENKWVSPPKH